MRKINPKKLLNSKWTAVSPKHKEKHFMVTDVEFDEEGQVLHCIIEAVLTKRAVEIQWFDLKDEQEWSFGWR
ncbi:MULTISPECIES: TIGR02450 family Trp-rich protein [Pseudoalteromonas]|uniref:TIGR02450 family Trp-rich protein n=2 Tax=Pseudoalteromonas TaxID=53246 RepID=A0A5S3YN53_9GAMM|nr:MULTISPECIES: TIGR02450 family Trp-rich protein [Pseudoalteromonas]TMO56902.1 TIGR02450 family Trp-rich protein [Pseudoalteromonas aurantia]TMO78523.1 TIGR02450 family Trp-rich protein [Pseudoalteromonas aurantia]TMP77040.1 TIGR02450 family Trp-rich protein [Pseudoalteromonas ruthenica]